MYDYMNLNRPYRNVGEEGPRIRAGIISSLLYENCFPVDRSGSSAVSRVVAIKPEDQASSTRLMEISTRRQYEPGDGEDDQI